MKAQYIHGGLCLDAENPRDAIQVSRMVKHSKSGLLWLSGVGGSTDFDGFCALTIKPMENVLGTKATNELKGIINRALGSINWGNEPKSDKESVLISNGVRIKGK